MEENLNEMDVNSGQIDEDKNYSTDEEANSEIDLLKLPNLELKRVTSTGSLSTGNRSVDTFKSNQFEEPEASRRASTMSTNTLSMGGGNQILQITETNL